MRELVCVCARERETLLYRQGPLRWRSRPKLPILFDFRPTRVVALEHAAATYAVAAGAMPVDEDVKAYFKKYSTEATPSEHFPLMELPAYDCEEKVSAPTKSKLRGIRRSADAKLNAFCLVARRSDQTDQTCLFVCGLYHGVPGCV